MRDLLHLICEYRQLLVRRDGPLSTRVRARLDALERLFGSEPPATAQPGPQRQHARCELEVPALLTVSGTEHQVTVINVGGGGLCVEGAFELDPGQRAVIRLLADGCLYEYPVELRWSASGDGRALAGMPFVGAGRRLELAAGIEAANDGDAAAAQASGR